MKISKFILIVFLVILISTLTSFIIQEAYYLKARNEVLKLDDYAFEQNQKLQQMENELDLFQERLETEWVGWEEGYNEKVAEYRGKEKEYQKRTESYNQMIEKIAYLINDLERRQYFLPVPGVDITIEMNQFF